MKKIELTNRETKYLYRVLLSVKQEIAYEESIGMTELGEREMVNALLGRIGSLIGK